LLSRERKKMRKWGEKHAQLYEIKPGAKELGNSL